MASEPSSHDMSLAFARISQWADGGGALAGTEQVRLVCTALMWLLTSPNRFLRDRASRSLVALLAQHLHLDAYSLTQHAMSMTFERGRMPTLG